MKSKIRNPKSERRPKFEARKDASRHVLTISPSLGFRVWDFGFGISDLSTLPCVAVGCLALAFAPSALAADTPWPKFTDVTEAAGIKFKHCLGDFEMSNIAEATGPGGMFFDCDNDGLLDLYLVNGRWHPDISDNRGRTLKGKLRNALYHNNGDGTFTDVTDKAGVGGYDDSYGMAASCADYDNDGDLDLYVCNYGRAFSIVTMVTAPSPT